MIIKCQEHYNKVVEYAKVSETIPYNSASNDCNSGKRTRTGNMKLNSTGTSHPIRSDSPKELPTGGQESSEGYSIMADRTNHTP